MSMSDSWAQDVTPTAGGQQQRRWVVLAVVLTGVFMILMDSTIINVAIPPIQKDLHAGNDELQWIVAGYALAYGLLLIPAGRLADRFGHKLVFLIGLAGFTIASVLCGISSSSGELVVWRIVQGVMAGVMNPPILALIQGVFPPKETGKAWGLYGAVAGVSTAAGPLLGGLLIEWNLNGWDWRPVFMINAPIGIVAFLVAIWQIRELKGRAGSIDWIGVLLITGAMLLLTFPLVEGLYLGWPTWTFVSMVASIPALALFALWENYLERKGKVPLVSMKLFKHSSVSAGVVLSVFYFAGFIGLLFALSLFLQIGLDKSALAAGLILLPFPAGTFIGAASSNAIAHKIGRRVLFIGATLVIVGIVGLVLTIHFVGTSGIALLPAMLIGGFGSGLIIAPSTEFVLAGVPWQDAGAASGVLSAAQRLGQAIGIAAVGVVLFGALGSHALASANAVEPALRQQLAEAGAPADAVDGAVATFKDCFDRQSSANDPTVPPAGCPTPDGTNPAGKAFVDSASTALRYNFTYSVKIAALSTVVALVLTFLMVFFLPKRPAEPWTGEWDGGGGDGSWGGGAGDGSWGEGKSGSGEWAAGGAASGEWGGGDASAGQGGKIPKASSGSADWTSDGKSSAGQWQNADGSAGEWSNEGANSSGKWKGADGSSGQWNSADGTGSAQWSAGSGQEKKD
jgi:EmrB/QacA subfamily drug resistance transporter